MKSFLKRLLLFSLPFILYVCIALYIDPYNVFYTSTNKKLVPLKNAIAGKLNYPLFKLQAQINTPKKIVLFGDSRADKLKSTYFNNEVSNIAYGGGTLPEIIDSFSFVSKHHNIDKVYISINFNLLNENNNMNRVKDATSLIENPVSYLFSGDCLKATFLILKSLITNKTIAIEKPSLTKEEFWKYQLETSAKLHYENFTYAHSFIKALEKLVNYCNANNIAVTFIIPPTHTDLQNRVADFNLVEEEKQFKETLATLADVYDFDYKNAITTHKNNFDDPYHFNDSIAKIIVNELTTNKLKYARFIKKNNP